MSFNILFTSVGRRVSLLRQFKQTLAEMDQNGKIIAADLQKNAAALFVADAIELVPRVVDPAYISVLKDICRRHEIKLLIPLIDTELSLLAKHKAEFASCGVTVLVSSCAVNDICFDKRNTQAFFEEIGAVTPTVYDEVKLAELGEADYPLFLKPARGSCSVGATVISNRRELNFYREQIETPIIQPLIKGLEYTIDVLVDFEGVVKCVVPRLRMETRAGEVSKAMTVKDAELIQAGKGIVEKLPGAVGCITLQCFREPNGTICFIEINPRFGGGFPLSFRAGADFPRWIIEMMLKLPCTAELDKWQDNLVMLRYDDEIIISGEILK